MRPSRALGSFSLGAFAGLAAAAAFVKRVAPSRGDADSDELALVAVFDGIELKSRATAFTGGSLVAWFGGIALDLSDVELAPGALLTVHTLFGGVALKTPASWRVESKVNVLGGGIDVKRPETDDPAAPLLRLEGLAILGGVTVGAKAGPF